MAQENKTKLLIYATVGTSLFENLKTLNHKENLRISMTTIDTYRDDCISFYKKDSTPVIGNEADIDEQGNRSTEGEYIRVRKQIYDVICSSLKTKQKLSAEIYSLNKIAERPEYENVLDVYVLLIATDSALSVMAAQCIQHWFEANKGTGKTWHFAIAPIKKLSVKHQNDYEAGFQNLLEAIDDRKPNPKNKEEQGGFLYRTFLDAFQKTEKDKEGNDKTLNDEPCRAMNTTGGYKSVASLLGYYALIQKIPVYYVYDDSLDADNKADHALIKLPPQPLAWSFEKMEIYYPLMSEAYLTAQGGLGDTIPDFYTEMEEAGLVKKNGEAYTVTAWGKLMQMGFGKSFGDQKYLSALLEVSVHKYLLGKGKEIVPPGYKVNDSAIKISDVFKKTEYTELDVCFWNDGSNACICEVKTVNKIDNMLAQYERFLKLPSKFAGGEIEAENFKIDKIDKIIYAFYEPIKFHNHEIVGKMLGQAFKNEKFEKTGKAGVFIKDNKETPPTEFYLFALSKPGDLDKGVYTVFSKNKFAGEAKKIEIVWPENR